MPQSEFIENLRESRDDWIRMQTLAVMRGLLPPEEHADAYRLLAKHVVGDDLATAALLTRVAACDSDLQSPDAVADWLITADLANADDSAAAIVDNLVSPVIRRLHRDGVPWSRWWDVKRLHHLFIELWTARQLSMSPPDVVSSRLRTIWQLSDRTITAMLANAPTWNPFSFLPLDLSEASITGEATEFLQGFVASGKHRPAVANLLTGHLPELSDRPDLIEIVRRIRIRRILERMIHEHREDIAPIKIVSLEDDITAWNAQMNRFLSGLTSYEIDLLRPSSASSKLRNQYLTAGRDLRIPTLGMDALPAQVSPGGPPKSAPLWMQDVVIGGGGRMFHASVGPYPVWLLTADSRLGIVAAEGLEVPSESNGIGFLVRNNHVEIKLKMPVPVGDPGPARVASFIYGLDSADHMWELLHLATAGYARVIVLSLALDGSLLVHRTINLSPPDQLRDKLTDHALTALRRLIGDDMHALSSYRAIYGSEDISVATFLVNEDAKGEDLLDEITGQAPAGVPLREWATFQATGRALARIRAQQAAAIAGGHPTPELATAVDRAFEDRERARALARSNLTEADWRTKRQSLATALPDEQSAFIHFFTKNGTLQAIYLARDKGGASLSPVRKSLISEELLLGEVQAWVNARPAASGWHQALAAILEALSEHFILQISDEIRAKGVTRLVISPTPPLDLLPLHAVPVNSGTTARALCQVFEEITYMPTVRLMGAITSRPATGADVPLIVTHSGRGVQGLPVISGPPLEADILRRLYPDARSIAERDATPRRVLTAMTGARIVHIAAHAFTPGDKWASGLVFHGKGLGQAMLRTGDILADGDLSSTQLVVLNACRTGTHRSAARVVQTLHGIEAAFLARGARTVISTLWEIDDLVAITFATLLHASLAAEDVPGQAFRKAVTYLRTEGWRHQDDSDASVNRAEALLDRTVPNWRGQLDRRMERNPLAWSAFKITGVI